jgi:hypothetical protein
MNYSTKSYNGGCLCGALRYQAESEPSMSGYCCCADCRKASGSGFVPFMGFASGALVFGGVVGRDRSFTIYAGSLDDPALFQPQVAIFTRDRPAWVVIPADLKACETLPV